MSRFDPIDELLSLPRYGPTHPGHLFADVDVAELLIRTIGGDEQEARLERLNLAVMGRGGSLRWVMYGEPDGQGKKER